LSTLAREERPEPLARHLLMDRKGVVHTRA
jgi:hypothetical protein